jgi:hypothetical protein
MEIVAQECDEGIHSYLNRDPFPRNVNFEFGLDGRHIAKPAIPVDADPRRAYLGAAAVARWPLPRASAMV